MVHQVIPRRGLLSLVPLLPLSAALAQYPGNGTASQQPSSAFDAAGAAASAVNGPQQQLTFYAHSYVLSNPTGCTVGGTTVQSPLECAFLNANAAIANNFEAQIVLGAETYNTYAPITIANASSGSALIVRSAGIANTVVNYAGTTQIDSVFEQQSTGTLARMSLSGGMRIQANKLAGHCTNFPYLSESRIDDVQCGDPTVSGMVFGGNTIFATNDHVGASGSYGSGSGAGFVATVSGGQITGLLPASGVSSVTTTAAGSGYTSPVLTWTGGNCATYPTGSVNTSGTAPNKTITGISTYIAGLCAASSPPVVTITDATGSGATFTVNMRATGGAGYSASTAIQFYGTGATGALDQPATTLPTATPTISGGVVTGATLNTAGAGVVSTIYVAVVDFNNPASYGFDISATDSSFYDLQTSIGLTAGMYLHGGPDQFYHYHPQSSVVGVLNTVKGQTFYGLECDSPRHYCIDTSQYITVKAPVLLWDNNGPYSGSGFIHTSNSNAYGSNVEDAMIGEQQTYGGYNFEVDSSRGPFVPQVQSASFPLNVTNAQDARPTFSQGPTATQMYSPQNLNNVVISGGSIAGTSISGAAGSFTGFASATRTVAASTTALATDFTIRANAASAAITITLPAAPTQGQLLNIVKTDSSANAITIAAQSGATINGAATLVTTTQYAAYQVQWDGPTSTWTIL